MAVTVKYCAEDNAACIRFSKEPVLESEEVSAGVILDYDKDGHIVGMELLDADKQLSPALLTAAA